MIKDEALEKLYEDTIGETYRTLETYIPQNGIGVFSQTWIVSKLVEKDQKVIEMVQKQSIRRNSKKLKAYCKK